MTETSGGTATLGKDASMVVSRLGLIGKHSTVQLTAVLTRIRSFGPSFRLWNCLQVRKQFDTLVKTSENSHTSAPMYDKWWYNYAFSSHLLVSVLKLGEDWRGIRHSQGYISCLRALLRDEVACARANKERARTVHIRRVRIFRWPMDSYSSTYCSTAILYGISMMETH